MTSEETLLLESGIPFKRIPAPANSKKDYVGLIIDAKSCEIHYFFKKGIWRTRGALHNGKGVGIKSAIKSARARMERDKVNVVEVRREKRYRKKTPANLLYKLELATKYYSEGNSMSKSARLADVDYRAFKQHMEK